MDYEKKFKHQNNYGWATTLNLSNKFPSVSKRIFNTLEDAESYINNYNDSAIEGLILTVVNDVSDKNGAYFVERVKMSENDRDGSLIKIGEVDLTNVLSKISANKTDIIINRSQILSLTDIVGDIEGDETVAEIINSNRINIENNHQLILEHKNAVDSYKINNKNITESPVLNSDDLFITNKYRPAFKIQAISQLDTITNAVSKVENSLASINLAISASLNHLESEVYGFKMKNITWGELKNLRNMSGLTPGGKYRIIDYETTTSKSDTESANIYFDLIVEAVSKNTISENAKACLRDGDTYLTDKAKLEAWEIKYCLDNSIERFDWADTTNGKGVIYYMKDEWGNEAHYDFKNIKKKGWFKYDDGNGNDTSYRYKILEL